MTRRPRTVLYAAWAPFFSGAERALLLTVRHLDPARYRPVVVVGTDGQLAAELCAHGIEVQHVPLVNTGSSTAAAWVNSVARLAQAIWRSGADLVHANDVISFQPAGYAARLLRRPALTHVRFPDAAAGFGWFLKPGFTRALFVSHALCADAVQAVPSLFENRSDVVHDGVLLPDVVDEPGRQALRAELGLPLDVPVVALTGQVSEIKGIWEFVDAAGRLVQRGVPACFAVLGDDLRGKGALRREMESRVRSLGLANHFRFLGFRPDAPRLLPAFDVIAVPSHIEPLGNATLEAMAAARPVVGTRVGGIPEMVVDGETGLLVAAKDGAQLADAIARLVTNLDQARTFGRSGRQRIERAFSMRAHATALQGVYDRVLAGAAA